MPTPDAPRGVDDRSDVDLLDAVRSGDEDAFGVLWERHAAAGERAARQIAQRFDANELTRESFARIIGAIRVGNGPRDSFRPYLYAVIRRVSTDWASEGSTPVPFDEIEAFTTPGGNVEEDVLERTVVRDAYLALRQEWREVLWYTEVEGFTAADVAQVLGTSANTASALAYRAREGLEVSWLQQHILRSSHDPECAWVADHLARHERGSLSRLEAERLERHVESCATCSGARAAVVGVAAQLRSLYPFILGLAPGTQVPKVAAVGAGTGSAPAADGRVDATWWQHLRSSPPVVTAAVVGVVVAGVLGVLGVLGVVGRGVGGSESSVTLTSGTSGPGSAQSTTSSVGTSSRSSGASSRTSSSSTVGTGTTSTTAPTTTSVTVGQATPPPTTSTGSTTATSTTTSTSSTTSSATSTPPSTTHPSPPSTTHPTH